MLLEIRALRFVVPLIGALFFVAACGGSGGGGTTTPAPAPDDPAPDDPAPDDPAPDAPDPDPDPVTLQSFFETPSEEGPSDAPEQNIVRQTLDAADNTPVGFFRSATETGGIRQESLVTGGGAPNIVIGENSGVTTFSILLRDPHNTTISFLIDTTDVANAPGSGTNANLEQDPLDGNGDQVTFTRTYAGTGNVHVYLKTDTPNSVAGMDDYLAYGFWIYDPVGAGATDIPVIGAFVDSNQGVVFPNANLDALTGTATYAGNAEGLYHEEVAGVSDLRTFTANASLTADFDAVSSQGGSVAGTIDTFVGLPPAFATLEVALGGGGTAPGAIVLTDGVSNLFTGLTSATVTLDGASRDLTGAWGGKFYDDTDSAVDTDHPGTVAGTFGLQEAHEDPTDANRMNRRALLGIYWADLE